MYHRSKLSRKAAFSTHLRISNDLHGNNGTTDQKGFNVLAVIFALLALVFVCSLIAKDLNPPPNPPITQNMPTLSSAK